MPQQGRRSASSSGRGVVWDSGAMLERLPIDGAGAEDSFADSGAFSSDECVELAFRLGDDDCRIYADAHGVSLEEAAARLSKNRQIGRIPLFDKPSLRL